MPLKQAFQHFLYTNLHTFYTLKRSLLFASLFLFILLPQDSKGQVDEDQLGAWYMYFFSDTFQEGPWGIQGDIQYRNWNLGGDLEQLLIRAGITYKPVNANIKFTLGYGDITTGTSGSDNATTHESRIYQEALFPVRFGNRFYTNHRFRFEQRFVDSQDFRTRYRYNLFLNIALNKEEMTRGTLYLALYNELFINGQRSIGDDRTVEIFDRNRFYTALGYVLNNGLKVQLGQMRQSTNTWTKTQLQLSLHQTL